MRSKILDLLRNRGGGCISGEEIARQLEVSRTAVWKHIKELRQAGYEIESRPRSGYSLGKAPDLLLPDEVRNCLQSKILGQRIEYLDDVDSTNNIAKKLAAKGAPEGTVVIAETQNGGRGRLARGWCSPKGRGIWFSVILRPLFSPQHAAKCTLLAAVSLVEAIEDTTQVRCGIKWPNDILYNGKKLVGILTEMSAEMDAVNYIVIGMGINVNIEPTDWPDEIKGIATSLMEIKQSVIDRKSLLARCLACLEKNYLAVRNGDFRAVLEKWRRFSVTLGQEVDVIGINEKFSGRATAIDEDGALLVETPTSVRRVLAGDVSIRPKHRA